MYRCEGCKATDEPEPHPEVSFISPRNRRELLPEGWVEMRLGGNKSSEVITYHYCGSCLTEVKRLLQGMALSSEGLDDIEMAAEGESAPEKSGETYELQKIRFKSREDANTILHELNEQIDRGEVISVAHLYDMVGIVSTSFTDTKWGWDEYAIKKTYVSQLASFDGYALALPQPINLKPEDPNG